MQYLFSTLTSWSTFIGSVATLADLIRSGGWLTGLSATFVFISLTSLVYARAQRQGPKTRSIEIDGVSIDTANAADLIRRVNRSLFVQSAEHTATIDGPDLNITWRYAGYCRADREAVMEFSVDAVNPGPFSRLDCFAYDLKADPQKRHRVQPLLVGPDGISKKLAVPFTEPLVAQQPFDIELNCRLPATYSPGICYYTSTLSFDQETVARHAVRLRFLQEPPDWLRVYGCDPGCKPQLLKNLSPIRQIEGLSEYRDNADNTSAQSTRIYVFRVDGDIE